MRYFHEMEQPLAVKWACFPPGLTDFLLLWILLCESVGTMTGMCSKSAAWQVNDAALLTTSQTRVGWIQTSFFFFLRRGLSETPSPSNKPADLNLFLFIYLFIYLHRVFTPAMCEINTGVWRNKHTRQNKTEARGKSARKVQGHENKDHYPSFRFQWRHCSNWSVRWD